MTLPLSPLSASGAGTERRGDDALTPANLERALSAMVPAFPSLDLRAHYLSARDAEDVLELRSRVFAGLPNPDMVLPEPDEALHVSKLVAPGNVAIGLRREDTGALLGYAAVLFSHEDSELPALAGLDGESRLRSAEIASCMLDQELRGHRLQRALLSIRERIAWSRGRSYLQVMTSPNNGPSRHNLLVAGYFLDWAGWVADPRRVRLVLAKDLLAPRRLSSNTHSPEALNTRTARLRVLSVDDSLRVSVNDPEALMKAVDAGWVSFVDDWKSGVLVFQRGAQMADGRRRTRSSVAELVYAALQANNHYVVDHVLTHWPALLAGSGAAQLNRLLVVAARAGPAKAVQALVAMGADIHHAEGLATAAAAVAGADACLRILLEHGADPRAPYQHRAAGALLEAARLGHSVAVELLLNAAELRREYHFPRAAIEAARHSAASSLSFKATRALEAALNKAS